MFTDVILLSSDSNNEYDILSGNAWAILIISLMELGMPLIVTFKKSGVAIVG